MTSEVAWTLRAKFGDGDCLGSSPASIGTTREFIVRELVRIQSKLRLLPPQEETS